MKKLIAAVSAATLAASTAHAGEFLIARSPEKGYDAFLDMGYLGIHETDSDDEMYDFAVTIKSYRPNSFVNDVVLPAKTTSVAVVDCWAGIVRGTEDISYDEKGNVISRRTFPPGGWYRPAEGSAVKQASSQICQQIEAACGPFVVRAPAESPYSQCRARAIAVYRAAPNPQAR